MDDSETDRIEEEVNNHMEENGFQPGSEKEYCTWLDGYIETQRKLTSTDIKGNNHESI